MFKPEINSLDYQDYCKEFTNKYAFNDCFALGSLRSLISDRVLSKLALSLTRAAKPSSVLERQHLGFLSDHKPPIDSIEFQTEFNTFYRDTVDSGRTINQNTGSDLNDCLQIDFESDPRFYVPLGFMFESIFGLLLKLQNPSSQVIAQLALDYQIDPENPSRRVDFAVYQPTTRDMQLYELKFGDHLQSRNEALVKFNSKVLSQFKSRFKLRDVRFDIINGSDQELPGKSFLEYFTEVEFNDEFAKHTQLLLEIYNFVSLVYRANKQLQDISEAGYSLASAVLLYNEFRYLAEFLYNLYEEFEPQNPQSNNQLIILLQTFATRLRLRTLSCVDVGKFQLPKRMHEKNLGCVRYTNCGLLRLFKTLAADGTNSDSLIHLYELLTVSHNTDNSFQVDTHEPLFSCNYSLTYDHKDVTERMITLANKLSFKSGGSITYHFLVNNASYESLQCFQDSQTIYNLQEHDSLSCVIKSEYREQSERLFLDLVRSTRASQITQISAQLLFKRIDPYLSFKFELDHMDQLVLVSFNISEKVHRLRLAKPKFTC